MNESVNRAFLYGESVFTTLVMRKGVVRDWSLHFDRLKRSVAFVYGPFTEGEDWYASLRARLETQLAGEAGDKIIRLTLYREQARGLHTPVPGSVQDLRLHTDVTDYDPGKWENKRYRLRTSPAPSRPSWWPSFLKCGNYLESILIQKKTLGPDDDDILFLSQDQTLLESSVSNIFVCLNGQLYTPPAGPQVLEGVMRTRVLETGATSFGSVSLREISLPELLRADGVFGTNSVRGLFLITRIDDHEISTAPDFLERFEKLKRDLEL